MVVGGASRNRWILARGAIRETEIVSGWPGVTNPSEPTRAFRKTNFVFGFPFEARAVGVLPAAARAGIIRRPVMATRATAAARAALPADTRGLSQRPRVR